jgi:hypothetical protein
MESVAAEIVAVGLAADTGLGGGQGVCMAGELSCVTGACTNGCASAAGWLGDANWGWNVGGVS